MRVAAPTVGSGEADSQINVLPVVRLWVDQVQSLAGAEQRPGTIGPHDPLPCFKASFQSFMPFGGKRRSEPTPAA